MDVTPLKKSKDLALGCTSPMKFWFNCGHHLLDHNGNEQPLERSVEDGVFCLGDRLISICHHSDHQPVADFSKAVSKYRWQTQNDHRVFIGWILLCHNFPALLNGGLTCGSKVKREVESLGS